MFKKILKISGVLIIVLVIMAFAWLEYSTEKKPGDTNRTGDGCADLRRSRDRRAGRLDRDAPC